MPSTGEGVGIVRIEVAACGVEVTVRLLDRRLGRVIDPRNLAESTGAVTKLI